LKSAIACSRVHEAAISNDRQLREYVSVTDMKIEIEISDVLQFSYHILENEERSVLLGG
jgi:hypothetical protein